jgi:hypothetical protein
MSWRDYLSPTAEGFEQRLREPQRRQPEPAPGDPRPYEANAELTLSGPPYEPLARHDLATVDPLQSFAEIFAQLRDELKERATVCVDLRAVPNSRAAKIRRFWLSRAPGSVSQGTLSEPETRTTPIGQVVSRRQDTSRLNDKLNPQEVLFEAQILIHIESMDPARPVYLIRSFLTSFQQWKGANELTVHGQLLGIAGHDLRFFGVDAFRWRRWWFKLRLTTGLFWPRAPALVTAWELAGILKPWTKNNSSTAPIRSAGIVPSRPRAQATDEAAV